MKKPKSDADRTSCFDELYGSAIGEELRSVSPEFFSRAEALCAMPAETSHLSRKHRALIAVAMNASATQMHEAGTRSNIKAALRCGATEHEVFETLQLASTIGIHACTLGIPILAQEIDPTGETCREVIENDPRRSELKRQFIEARGYWNDIWNSFLWLDPDYFEAFTAFSSAPWKNGTLEPKVKEFIYIAADTSPTHLFEMGTRIHIQNALKLGATKEEICEVLQIVSSTGLHAIELGLPILTEEVKNLTEKK